MNEHSTTSTRPYLIRALHEWCTDNGLTPYLAVKADRSVQVPQEFVNDGEIVLNISYDATGSLQLGNDFIEFKARFGGKSRDIMVPVERVQAIYARETGQGMSFPVLEDLLSEAAVDAVTSHSSEDAGSAVVGTQARSDVSPAQVMQLVTTEGKKPESSTDEKPRPTVGGTSRPSLKRVK